MKKMKKFKKSLAALLLALAVVMCAACGTKNTVPKEGLWETATYLADTEIGKGATTLTTKVVAGDNEITFTVHTDKTTVGAALLEAGLVSGDETAYGLYVKVVNGITADYDVDQSYWAFYIDGEYAMTGVDSTDIVEGTVYSLEYTK